MADITANYKVEQQRLKMQIAAQEHAIEQRKLEIMEMASKKDKALEQIEAAQKAIDHFKSNMKDLGGAHGKLSEQDFEKAKEGIDNG